MEIMRVSEAIEEAILKSRKLKEGIIRGKWHVIVEKLSKKSEPLWIKDSTLYVLVEDSMYLHHMSMNKSRYLEKINELLKNEYIKDIRFKISKINNFSYESIDPKTSEIESKDFFLSELKKELSLVEKIEILKRKSIEREKVLTEKGYTKCISCGAMFLGEEKICKPCSLKEKPIVEERNDSK